MGGSHRHRWDVSPAEAAAIQLRLAPLVDHTDRLGAVRFVAGVDVSFPRPDVARAAAVVLELATLDRVEARVVERPVAFPYRPGLLSFREAPAALAALDRLEHVPDLLLCDGQGLAHPRRFGLACHLGLLADLPSVGVAKTLLVGAHDPVPEARGAWRPLVVGGEVVGAALRTRTAVRPVFVSVGHRVSLPTALHWVLRCTPRYRLPETTRWAHRLAALGSRGSPR